MKILKCIYFVIALNSICALTWAQTPKRKAPKPTPTTSQRAQSTKPATKISAYQRTYKELHLGLNLVTDKFGIDVEGDKADLRGMMQGLSLTYTFYRPSRNISWLYSYGLGATIGMLKASPNPFQTPFAGQELKNKIWFMGSFVPGLDFRRTFRSRIGVFAPVVFRVIDFGYDEDTVRSFDNDPFSFGVGVRYVNVMSTRNSFSLSFAHQIVWSSSTWEFVWQRRLGL